MNLRHIPRYVSLLAVAVCLLALYLPGCGGGSSDTGINSNLDGLSLEQAQPGFTVYEPAPRVYNVPGLDPARVDAGLDELDQLGELPGVSPDVQQRLVTALQQAFRELGQNGRLASALPDALAVDDFQLTASADGSADFNWSYRNLGDYDQNGEVGISDVAVIGMFFRATTESPDWQRAKVADGDGNGEVNAGDVVPIAINFQSAIEAYTIFSSATPENDMSWSPVSTVEFTEGSFPEGATIKRFNFTLDSPEQGMSYIVQPGRADVLQDPAAAVSVALFDASSSGRPQNLTASEGTHQDQVQLSWDELDETLLYEIYRAGSADGEFVKLGSKAPGSSLYFDFNVETGLRYFYHLRSLLPTGYSANSDVVEGWLLDIPAAPENVAATDGDFEDRVDIAWSPVATATNYQINRSNAVDDEYTSLGTAELATFTDDTGDWGIAYFYHVQAVNPVGVSTPSLVDQGNSGVLGVPPTVDSVSPLTSTEGLLATFSAEISGNPPQSYLWDFDGAATTSTQSSPTVQLGAPGTYDCTLTVANDWGGEQFAFILNINAQNSSISEVTPMSGVENTSITFSASSSGGSATGWVWDFGGGATPNTSTESTPTVQLDVIGSYNASLEKQTSSGSDTFFFTLQVIAGLPNLVEVGPLGGDEGDTITLNATNTGGSITSWAWDFGGGAAPNTSTLESPTVTLPSGGNFSGSVMATNDKGSSTYLFSLNVIPPAPIITDVSPVSGVAGNAISPISTNVGGVASSFAWYFGGGATPNSSALEIPTITLGAVGTYSCTLVATNVNGSVLFPFTLTSTPPPPTLIQVLPNTGVSGATLQPLATNTGGAATSWAWDFGGGGTPDTSTAAAPAISLGDPGVYNASVSATNDAGTSTVNFPLTINVAAPEISSAAPQSGQVGESATFTASNNGGDVTNWAWNFGGGATPTTSTDENPVVILGAAGTYDCTVIATNASGSDTHPFTLGITTPPPNVTAATPLAGTQGGSVTFSATNDGGAADSWAWVFDGGATPGTSTEASPTVVLGTAGTYNMSVLAQNSSGSSLLEFEFAVAPVPPDITAVAPLSGVEGTTYAPILTNDGGAITTWSWDFGGGATPNTSALETPSVTLSNEGSYTASVTGTNESGSDTFTFTITVDPELPNLSGISNLIGVSGETYAPTATNVGGSVASWSWDFGGGTTPNTSTSGAPSVTAGSVNTYSASVTATNVTGSDTFNFTLTVDHPAPDVTVVAPLSGIASTVYSPTPTNSGGPVTTWAWNFGGGATPNTSSSGTPTPTLNAPGIYSASVTATNVTGSDTYNFTLTVDHPVPDITTVTPTSGATAAVVTFSATNNGGLPTTWSWNFDGGATPDMPTSESPTVTLGATGTYNASVTATNSAGSDTYNFTLTVT